MPLPLTRTQILLEPEQHRALTELARRQNRSLSDLVRAIVSQELEHQACAQAEMLRQRQQTLGRITRHRAAILDRRGGQSLAIDVDGEISRMREDRDEEIGRALADDRG